MTKSKKAKPVKKTIPFPGTETLETETVDEVTDAESSPDKIETAKKSGNGSKSKRKTTRKTKSGKTKDKTSAADSSENGNKTAETGAEKAECAKKPREITLEQHQRLLAEFDNFRKRTDRERQRTSLWARADILKSLIPVLDDCDRAQKALKPEDISFDREGMLIIMDRLAETLSKEGLVEVPATPGDVFDPEIHEAVMMIPSADIPAGCVADVLEKGFRVEDRLLRPAKVVVVRSEDTQPDGGDK